MIKRKTILTLTVLAAQLLFAPGCVQPGPAALCFHPFARAHLRYGDSQELVLIHLYRRRYPIEATFRDYKSFAWRWEQGQVRELGG